MARPREMEPAVRGSRLGPGAWIGIVGGGQLGRMTAMEARRMGYRVCVLDPDPDCPAGQVADRLIARPYDDGEGAALLAEQVAVVTYEFENVDVGAIEWMERRRPVRPSSAVLRVKQNRLREKTAVAGFGLPVAAYAPVASPGELDGAAERLGLPLVLKTATEGYDGKGQWLVSSLEDAREVAGELGHSNGSLARELVAEEYVRFAKELSVICARDACGRTACYPVVENVHQGGILDITIAPARIPSGLADEAQGLALRLAEALDVVGLVAVELFLTEDGRLLVNEFAPRPHNSGHHTLDACATSQFEQLLRVLCGLPLGDTGLLTPVVMLNLLGDLWVESQGKPDFAAALRVPGVKLHLYGKAEARLGRKMGHLTVVASSVDLALERGRAARAAIRRLDEETPPDHRE